MKGFLTNPHLRRQLTVRLLEVAVLALVVTGCFIGYGRVKAERAVLFRQEKEVAAKPLYLLGLSKIQGELRGRQADIDRILQLVEDPNNIVGFIENIEGAAKGHDIALTVSKIDEISETNEAGEPLSATGPFRAIRLTITGAGDAADLVEYVHDLEHGQRLVAVRAWEIAVDTNAVTTASQLTAGRELGQEAPAKVVVAPSAQLNAELILLVHNEKYSP